MSDESMSPLAVVIVRYASEQLIRRRLSTLLAICPPSSQG